MKHQHIKSFFEKNCPLNAEGMEELFASFKHKIYPKNSVILKEGQLERNLRFLNKGVVREFYANDTKENNINFYVKPNFVSDFSSFMSQIPTKKFQETLSEVEILELSSKKLDHLLEKNTCGKSIIDHAFQKLLKAKDLFEYNRITKEPQKLYQEMQQYHPDWLQMIPQYHLASYLGITPETLSRIRKRLS